VPGHDHAFEQRRRSVARLPKLLEHDVRHEHRRVESDEVEQRERAHRIAAAELHRLVDVLQRREPALVDADGIEEIRHEQTIDDERRRVLRLHGNLADRAHPFGGLPDGDVVGEQRPHDLDQLHQWHWIEEVEADDLSRTLGGGGHGGDVARRGVRGQQRVRRADAVELGEGLVLQCLVLGHCLHDEIGGLEVFEPRGAGDPAERLVLDPRFELAFGHEAVQRLAEPVEPALDEVVVGLDEEHLEARLRGHLHDARAHETAADDADVLDRHVSFLER